MPETGYQVLSSEREEEVHFQFTPNIARNRWNHIEDLDTFFTRIYLYHQRHGFICLILQSTLDLLQVIFLLVFSLFLFYCIDYPVLFRDKPADSSRVMNGTDKVRLSDVFLPASKCASKFTFFTYLYMIPLLMFAFFRLMKVFNVAYHFADIKAFYNVALHIPDKELQNYTWREIIHKVIEAQKEQNMCIHKLDLTELDIYQRILRTKNYLIALVNKSVLPTHFNIPFLGDVIYFSHGMKYNLNLLLFWGPWSPFENNWHLKPEYKQPGKRLELARSMRKTISWVALINILLSPVIFTWQLIYKLCDNAQMVKNEPSVLSIRMWSLYSKIYLRHFNELDHELSARLSRAYVPGAKYLQSFAAPVSVIIAKNTMFFTSAIMVSILAMTVYDDSILSIEHMITILTEVAGVGDVCAFSMMNLLSKNGNPAWRSPGPSSPGTPTAKLPQVDQAEDGKVEMSLLSFSVRNPNWDPVDIEAKEFVDEIIAKTRQKYTSTSNSIINPFQHHDMIGSTLNIAEIPSCLIGLDQSTRLLHKEGLTGRPNRINCSSIMRSSIFSTNDYLTSMEVNQSALLLHSIHRKQLDERGNNTSSSISQSALKTNTNLQERTPLLKPGARII
ncbi:autophagy-related protein 9A [Acyrthosiphon pisum]|uniref:Autophagy-related protein 9 n=1 Tax=Acyrthosiphon pisum TaxID=7029 RepID=A0A8R2D4U0_ACYPI|nr:autophagy-related protein 9A [Acyrthosiphon pisum]|eukprot:XP_016661530.1 PREDICTED: autophagy-related protein 9A [Acyrthosiphon pisum]